MKKFMTVMAFALALASSAEANFGGNWRGTGSATNADGSVTQCQESVFSLAQTASNFNLISGKVDCGEAGAYEMPEVNLSIRSGGLYYSIMRIGQINDTYFEARYSSSSAGNNTFQGWLINDSQIQYRHTVIRNGQTSVVDMMFFRQ